MMKPKTEALKIAWSTRRVGLTLLEVLAATVLLTIAMLFILRSEVLHWRQIQRARLVDQALPAIDRFLADITEDPSKIGTASSGPLPDPQDWYWILEENSQSTVDLPASCRLVTVQFYETRNDQPVFQCDLILPRAAEPTSQP